MRAETTSEHTAGAAQAGVLTTASAVAMRPAGERSKEFCPQKAEREDDTGVLYARPPGRQAAALRLSTVSGEVR